MPFYVIKPSVNAGVLSYDKKEAALYGFKTRLFYFDIGGKDARQIYSSVRLSVTASRRQVWGIAET